MYEWNHLPWKEMEKGVFKLAIRAFIKPPVVEKPKQFTSYRDSSPSHGMPVSLRYDELPRTIKERRQPG
jgi:hypothetical protein